MKNNPYTLSFGREPQNMIQRYSQTDEILNGFQNEIAPQSIYMIAGARGSGKTVLMTSIASHFRKEKDWVVLELNPTKDLLNALAAALYEENELKEIFKKARINLSLFGIGVEIANTHPIYDIEIAVRRMLESLKKKKKKVLVTIDEVVSTKEMQIFASAFQIFIREDLPLFLLMTGLYENINKLQNEPTLTFLYRAPKIYLKALNLGSVAAAYEKSFEIDHGTARRMAQLTRGYSFAFQVLGYFTWEKNGKYEEALSQYRQYLDEYSYDKIWAELSAKEREILALMARLKSGKISVIREELSLSPYEFSPYRDRLIRKGILSGEVRGLLEFSLPYFEDYILDHSYE